MTSIRVVQIGIGGFGAYLLRPLLDPPPAVNVRVIATVDPFPPAPTREGLDRLGIPIFADLPAFLARERADLAVIATPIPLHADQAVACLQAGMHVLCEKPAAAVLEDGRRMLAAAQATGRFCAIGFQWSFAPSIRRLKALLRSGSLGRPLALDALACWPRPASYFSRNRWAGRVRDDAGRMVLDSPVANACAHFLHNALFVLGEAEDAAAMPTRLTADLGRANAIETFDSVGLRAEVGGVPVGLWAAHPVASLLGPLLRYRFSEAEVVYAACKGGAARLRVLRGGRVAEELGDPEQEVRQKLWDCVAAAAGGPPPVCTIATALPHLACANACHRSCPAPATSPAIDGTWEEQPLRYVPGMDADLVTGFTTGRLPSELGCTWAAAGQPVTPGA